MIKASVGSNADECGRVVLWTDVLESRFHAFGEVMTPNRELVDTTPGLRKSVNAPPEVECT